MGSLLAETLPLALGAAVSPVLLVLTLTTLSGPRRLARGAALAIGAAVPLAALSFLAVVVGITTGHMSRIDEVALDLRAARHGATARPEQPLSAHPAGLGRSFMLGLAGMATNVTTIALSLA